MNGRKFRFKYKSRFATQQKFVWPVIKTGSVTSFIDGRKCGAKWQWAHDNQYSSLYSAYGAFLYKLKQRSPFWQCTTQTKESSSWYVVTEVEWLTREVTFGKYPEQYNLAM